MKITIKLLQARIRYLEADAKQWRDKYVELRAEKDKELLEITNRRDITLLSETRQHSRDLMEIIRWHINPDTARYPFESINQKPRQNNNLVL